MDDRLIDVFGGHFAGVSISVAPGEGWLACLLVLRERYIAEARFVSRSFRSGHMRGNLSTPAHNKIDSETVSGLIVRLYLRENPKYVGWAPPYIHGASDSV